MIKLAVLTVRRRPGNFVAAFLAMFIGAVIVMACGGLLETGLRGVVPMPRQLADADVVVAGNANHQVPEVSYTVSVPERVRIDADLVDVVAEVPGVADATGVVLDPPAPTGTIDAVAVVAEGGTSIDELASRIGAGLPPTAVTLTGDDRGLAEHPEAVLSAEGLRILGMIMGAWAVLIAAFGAAQMLGLTVSQRQRELALLRAIGATPGQVRRLVLGETAMLAVIAILLAVLPARLVGEFLFDQFVATGHVVEGSLFQMGWVPTAIGGLLAIVASIGGAAVAARRAARTRPTEALAAADLPDRRPVTRGRVIFGLVMLVLGLGFLAATLTINSGELASGTASPAVLMLGIAAALLSPLLLRPAVALLRPLARTGQSGRMAYRNIRAGVDRTAAVVTPVIVLVGITSGLLYMETTGQAALRARYVDSLATDVVVTAEAPGADIAGLAQQIAAEPGVAAASPYVRSSGWITAPVDDPDTWGTRWAGTWRLEGTTPGGAAAVLPGPVVGGSIDELTGSSIALDRSNAQTLGVGVGDEMTLLMGDNAPLDVTVVALYDAARDNGERHDDRLVLPADTLAVHTTAGHPTEVAVTADAQVDPEQLASELSQVVAGVDQVSVTDRNTMAAEHASSQNNEALPIYSLVALIIGYSAISVIATLSSSTAARRREFGLQRLTGFTDRQVLGMLTAEGLVIAVAGIVLGTLVGFGSVVAYSIGRSGVAHIVGGPIVYLLTVLAAVLLTLFASLVPAWRALRQRAVEAVAG